MKLQKQKLKKLNRRSWWLIVSAICGAVALQLVLDGYLLTHEHPSANNAKLAGLIIDAANNNSRPAVVEPVSRQVYVPDARLKLPYYPYGIKELRTHYSQAVNDLPETIEVTDRSAVSQAAAKLQNIADMDDQSDNTLGIFKQVPQLQACGRGITISLQKPGDGTTTPPANLGSKQLKDGRTASFNKDTGCPYLTPELLAYVVQVESY